MEVPPTFARLAGGLRYTIALVALALIAAGCASWRLPRIDPSGQQIFLSPDAVAAAPVPVGTVIPGIEPPIEKITLSPRQVIAPVGSDVVLLAGVCGEDGYLRVGERIEWMLAPEGVGELVTLGDRDRWLALRRLRNTPRKVDNQFAVGSATAFEFNITRGTPTPSDDVPVYRGQAWLAVTSPTEGTSHITAFAPSVRAWDLRKATSVIHWVDAQWQLPAAAINPVGASHVLTTTVTRQSDGAPVGGWIVRYEVLGGPAAGFGPDGSPVVDVPTDAVGQASVDIAQAQPQGGASQIGIQIIRPASATSPQLVVGSGTTTCTWTAPQLALRLDGPAVATPGSNLIYRLDLSNPGDLPTGGVEISQQIPAGLEYVASSPVAATAGDRLQWNVEGLGPRETRSFEVTLRALAAGSFDTCAEAQSAEGLTARDCATSSVAEIPSAAPLDIPPATPIEATPPAIARVDLSVTGPARAEVGGSVRYEVRVTNTGSAPARGLIISDKFDAGLEHLVAESPIERDLDELAPGESQTIFITFTVAKAGELCHLVEVTDSIAGSVIASRRSCVTVVEPGAPPRDDRAVPPADSPPADSPPAEPAWELDKTGPQRREVGQTAEFFITLRNTGNVPLTNLRITDNYEAPLNPVDASEGFAVGRGELVWNVARLEPGATYRLQVNCTCMTAVARACNRVTVRCDQRPPIADEACVEIVGAAAPPDRPENGAATPERRPPRLTVSIVDLGDPIRSGDVTTYRIFVANEGEGPATAVGVDVTLPDEVTATADGVTADVGHVVSGRIVRFEPVAELPAGHSRTYSIRVRALRSGNVTLTATVASAESATPVTETERTEIVRP